MNIRLTSLTVLIRATLTALLVAGLPLMFGPFNPTVIPTANAAGVTVSNTRVTATTDNTASLAWDTSINSCAQINYGTTPGSLNRQDFEGGCPKSTGHTHTITGLASNTLYYYQIVAIGSPAELNGVSPQLSFTTSGGAPLAISNINVVNIGPTNATITWSTNKIASGKLKYGLTTTYELPEVIQGTADSTSHSIPLFGLSQGTTYHFRVESTAGSETDSSTTDRTFVTTSGTGTGSLPYLTTPPRHNAVNNQAIITFSTNVPTAALIEYEQTPNTTLSAQACDAATNCAPPPPPQPNSLSLNHTVTLTGLTVASAEYSYKITIIDAGSNISSTSEFTFNTSASGTDHVFSTGGCNDGTPIGQCNAAGQFCRPGGGEPVYDCRPTTPCSSQCTTNSTCQPNGDCTVDPNLTGSPAQCNQKICYQHCNANSGNKSGLACTNDGECVDAAAGLSGKCTVGSFNNPTVPGCYASWPSCDANIILKVRPDRVCDKWMTCKTSLPITDTQGKTENQCFDLTICNSLSPNGQCNGVLEGGQCSNDPLRFCQTDADCNGGGRCLTADNGGPVSVTYSTPGDVGQIANLTGYSRAGLDWGNDRIEGNYPYSLAQQIGTRVKIENSDFEDITFVGSCKNKRSQACNADEECKNGSNDACQFQADSTVPLQQVWEGVTPTGSTGTASVVSETEGATNSRNVYMKVTPTDRSDSGARMINEARFTTQTNQQYVLAVRLRSAQSDQPIKITLSNDSNVVNVLDDENPDGVVKLSTSWKTYRLGPVDGPGGRTRLNILTAVTGDPAAYYVDDLALLPALKVNDATLITQNCRIFPGDDSPKCDYVDGNGVTQTGFKGFCLERDPLNSAVCISWWPVDILAGENIFAQDTNTGYQGRRPLYACAEAIQENVPTTAVQGFGSSPDDGVFITGDNAPDATYRDCSAFDNHSCAATATHNISLMNIQLQDIQFVRLNFNPDESNDWNATFNYDYLDDGAIGLSGGDFYYIDVYPNPGTDPDFNSSPYFGTGKLIEQDDGGTDKGQWPRSWKVWVEEGSFKASGGGKKNGVGVRIWSDGILPTSKLTAISVAAFDDSSDDFSPDWNVWIMKRPYCKKLAQLAGGQDSAWVDRTGPTSTYVVPDLNLRNESDLEPFGMVANPGTPLVSNWPKLFTEGRNLDFPAPTYQVRGGIAYACAPALSGSGYRDTSVPIQSLPGLCGVKRCAYAGRVVDGNSTAKPCFDNSDCKVGTELGVCVGSGQCLKYDEARHEFDIATSSKIGCATDAACTAAGEKCVGGNASYKGNQTFGPTNPPIDTTDPAPTYAQYRLQRLFAQAFSIWEWNSTTNHYDDVTGARVDVQRWLPPTNLCRVCSGTNAATNGKACTSNASCGSGSTCISGDRHPRVNANPTGDSTADYCAIQPQVINVKANDRDEVTIGDGSLLLLKFNTKVDREQVPITRITIDWGDGSPNTIDSGLRIAPKEGTDVPHLYAHTFDCRSVRCEYFPKVQIEDNWGWCSDGTHAGAAPCNDNPNSTANPWVGGVKVIVE